MRLNKNSMDKFEYVFTTLLYVCCFMFTYTSLLFVPINGLSARVSKVILWAVVLVFVLIGTADTFRKGRNGFNLFINILFPLEIYAVISYWCYFKVWVAITLVLTLAAVCVFYVLVVFRKTSQHKTVDKELIERRKKRTVKSSKTIAALCLSVFIIPLSLTSILGIDLYIAKSTEPITIQVDREQTIKDNLDVIGKVVEWKSLSIKEKLEALECVKNIELAYLGVNEEIPLSADNIDDNTLACYNVRQKKIQVNIEFLETGGLEEIIESVLHECHHVYTYEQVLVYQSLDEKHKDLLLFRDAQVYEKEYALYEDGKGYSDQCIEIDANEYAEEAFESYWVVLNEAYPG